MSMGDGKRSPLVGVGFILSLAAMAAVGLTMHVFGGVAWALALPLVFVAMRRGPLAKAVGAYNEESLEERRRREELLTPDQRRLFDLVAPPSARWRSALPASPRRVRSAAAELDMPVAEVRRQLATIDAVLRRPRSNA